MAIETDPIRYLRRLLESGQHNDVEQMIRDRGSVLERYGPVFRNPSDLDEDTFVGFLRFENNRHWWNLHRAEERLVRDFDLLRDVLTDLVDEERPLDSRIARTAEVSGLDSEVYSAILTVAYPERYGVWGAISESAMQRLGIWPEIPAGATEGGAYTAVNAQLTTIADDLGVDLWTLDALWWGAEKEHDPTKHFVARRRSVRSDAPRRSRSRAPTPSKARAPEPQTFMCLICFATKQVRLESDTPGVCIDCA